MRMRMSDWTFLLSFRFASSCPHSMFLSHEEMPLSEEDEPE